MSSLDPSMVLELWPDTVAEAGAPPESEFLNPDFEQRRFLRSVSVPTLTAFLPERARSTGTAVIVCPGGALHTLAIDYEGYDVARWLCGRGIAAFVLKYRLILVPVSDDEFLAYFGAVLADFPRLLEMTRRHTPTVLADGQRAVTMVRERAAAWGIAPDRVGMLGFSAGAFLTVITTLHAERASRPDFAASIYGALWEDLPLTPPLPPLFIALADDDALTVEPSLQLYSAWHSANSPVEMHVYAEGGHGFAMRNINPAAEGWIDRYYEWMQVQGLVKG